MDFTMYTKKIIGLCGFRRMTDYPTCDVDTGLSMFLGDVKNGYATDDNTAGFMPEVNFAVLKAKWDAATEDEKSKAIADVKESIRRAIQR